MKYKEGFIQQTRLETDLILTRIATLITNEKWEIEIGDSDISEEVKLSLDLIGYTVPHTLGVKSQLCQRSQNYHPKETSDTLCAEGVLFEDGGIY